MAKHEHEILSDEAVGVLNDPHRNPALPDVGQTVAVGDKVTLDLSLEQRRAMVAAGWISDSLDAEESSAKSKGGKS